MSGAQEGIQIDMPPEGCEFLFFIVFLLRSGVAELIAVTPVYVYLGLSVSQ